MSHSSDNRMSPGGEGNPPQSGEEKNTTRPPWTSCVESPTVTNMKNLTRCLCCCSCTVPHTHTQTREVTRDEEMHHHYWWCVWGQIQKYDFLKGGWSHFLSIHSWLLLSSWQRNQLEHSLFSSSASVHPGQGCDNIRAHSLQPSLLFSH